MSNPNSSEELVISRVFKAPRELVFKTMTEAAHLQKWWGPAGCTLNVLALDASPGGVFHYRMQFVPSAHMYGKFVFQEIQAPERLVYISGFADEAGNMVRNPMSPAWPLETLNTVTLTEDNGMTTLTQHSRPHNASQIERDTFKAGHMSMQQGFSSMYDLYERYLATL